MGIKSGKNFAKISHIIYTNTNRAIGIEKLTFVFKCESSFNFSSFVCVKPKCSEWSSEIFSPIPPPWVDISCPKCSAGVSEYPNLLISLFISSLETFLSSKEIFAFSVAKLTSQLSTPGIFLSFFTIIVLQLAQCIPLT